MTAKSTATRLLFTAPYTLTVQDVPRPAPGPGELLVQTELSAISAGTELLVYRGQLPAGLAADDTITALAGELAYPLAYGYAAVGRVVAAGPGGATADWIGRRVFAFQPHASHFVAPPQALLPLPPGMAPETAVFLPNVETAVSFLMDGAPVIGERVVVLGQGIVGLLTAGLLARLPLADLVTVDRYALRRDWSRRLGAHASLPPDAADLAARLQAHDVDGADLAYELSGSPAALNLAIALAGFGSRIVVGSWYGQKQAPLDLGGRFHRGHMRLISSQVSHLAPRWQARWSKDRRLQVAWRALADLDPARLITHRFSLAEAAAAYRLLDEAPETAVQVVFTYAADNS